MLFCRGRGNPRKQDSRWSYVVCLCATLSQALIMGIAQGFGIFLPVIMDEFNTSREYTGEWLKVGCFHVQCFYIYTHKIPCIRMHDGLHVYLTTWQYTNRYGETFQYWSRNAWTMEYRISVEIWRRRVNNPESENRSRWKEKTEKKKLCGPEYMLELQEILVYFPNKNRF